MARGEDTRYHPSRGVSKESLGLTRAGRDPNAIRHVNPAAGLVMTESGSTLGAGTPEWKAAMEKHPEGLD